MFKWPDAPSPQAPENELADYLELTAWQNGGMSAVELSQLVGRLGEDDYSDGVPEEDEDISVGNAIAEVERRDRACSRAYPFKVDDDGQVVQFEMDANNEKHAIYLFLLLTTRLNMKDGRVQGGFDGTRLFEELAAESVRQYLGARSESLVFGTGGQSIGFKAKVDDLCVRIGEGDGFIDDGGSGSRHKDGKLDIVAWIPFSDGLPGKLLVFGQCKTGTHFRDQLTQLQPDAFCRKWLRLQPAVPPVRAFFVTEALPLSRWRDVAVDAGLLFDRCRIVDFTDGAKGELLDKVQAWTAAAWAHTA